MTTAHCVLPKAAREVMEKPLSQRLWSCREGNSSSTWDTSAALMVLASQHSKARWSQAHQEIKNACVANGEEKAHGEDSRHYSKAKAFAGRAQET